MAEYKFWLGGLPKRNCWVEGRSTLGENKFILENTADGQLWVWGRGRGRCSTLLVLEMKTNGNEWVSPANPFKKAQEWLKRWPSRQAWAD